MSKDAGSLSFQGLCSKSPPTFTVPTRLSHLIAGDGMTLIPWPWLANLHFIIPVRNQILERRRYPPGPCAPRLPLSDDNYHFEFVKLKEAQAFQGYLKFDDDGRLFGYPEQVVMFSGGLDPAGHRSHRAKHWSSWLPTNQPRSLNTRHRRLEKMIADKAGITPATSAFGSIRTRLTEYTQRSRSFLYVSIGDHRKMLNPKKARFTRTGHQFESAGLRSGSRRPGNAHHPSQGDPRFQEIISLAAGETVHH